MNMKYARLVSGAVEYAPDVLSTPDGIKVNPSEASYLAAGWKKVVDAPPEPEAGKDVVFARWDENETDVFRVYEQVDHVEPEPQPEAATTQTLQAAEPGHRVISKLKLLTALKERDRWVLVKTWLEEKSYYDYYLAAQEFREDHPLFAEAVAALKEYARITDEEIEEIVSASVAD